MQKKIAAVLLAAVMTCAAFTGCSVSSASSSTSSSSKPASSSSSSSSTNSSSSNSSSNSSSSSSSSESLSGSSFAKKLTFSSPSYNIVAYDDCYYIYYCFAVSNTNKFKDFDFVKIDFTVKDASGKILDTSRESVPPIAAGDTIVFGGHLYISTGKPANVSYSFDYPSYCMSNHDSSKFSKQSDLVVSNSTCIPDGSDAHFTGEITNHSSVNIDSVEVRVYYRKDGKVLPGESSYIYKLSAGQTKAFSIYATDVPASYDSFVILATQS